MDDYQWLDATAQADLVRRREVKPTELVDAALARIAALNPELNAVVTPIDPRPAQADGPFAGVPFLVKDLAIEVSGTPFTEGSRWLAANVSTSDQELALRYRKAGLVIIGKTNTCEFGLSPTVEPALFGPTRNPWDRSRSTGGSSGGSAAAVAAGLVPMAHANDLGGSIRYPAAWCGLFGLKPTRARVPIGPEYGDVVSGYACEHAVTRSVRDSAALLDAVSGPALGDPYWAPPPPRSFVAEVGAPAGRLRIAVSTRPRGGQSVDPAWTSAVEQATKLLEQLGHVVEEASPDGLAVPEYEQALGSVYRGAVGWIFGYWSRRIGRPPADGEIEPQTRAYFESAQNVSAADYLLGVEALQRISRKVACWFESYDGWLTPDVRRGTGQRHRQPGDVGPLRVRRQRLSPRHSCPRALRRRSDPFPPGLATRTGPAMGPYTTRSETQRPRRDESGSTDKTNPARTGRRRRQEVLMTQSILQTTPVGGRRPRARFRIGRVLAAVGVVATAVTGGGAAWAAATSDDVPLIHGCVNRGLLGLGRARFASSTTPASVDGTKIPSAGTSKVCPASPVPSDPTVSPEIKDRKGRPDPRATKASRASGAPPDYPARPAPKDPKGRTGHRDHRDHRETRASPRRSAPARSWPKSARLRVTSF